MQGFWKLTTVVLSLAGFLITGGLLLSKGEMIPEIIWKAIAVFTVLYVIGNYLGGILFSVINPGQPISGSSTQKPASKK